MVATLTKFPIGLTILAAASLGGILVVAGMSTAKVLSRDAPAEAASVVLAPSSPLGWVSRLKDSKCEAACIGGTACAATGNKACPSKFTCVLGSREDTLELDMPLSLHLSALVSPEPGTNPCSLDLVACLTPSSTKTSTCIPVSDACRHDGHSTLGVPILTRDLVSGGIAVSIREGSSGPTRPAAAANARAIPDGKTETKTSGEVATGTIRYGTPIRKVGLCTGFKYGGLVGSSGHNIRALTFFVEPHPSRADSNPDSRNTSGGVTLAPSSRPEPKRMTP